MSCFRKPKVADTDYATENTDQVIAIAPQKYLPSGVFYIERRTVETMSGSEAADIDYLLPPYQRYNVKTLVFDLDDTLIRSFFDPNSKAEFEIKLDITPQTSDLQQDFNLNYIPVYIAVRNGAHYLLKKLSKYYELILWTASVQEYADAVLRATKLAQYFYYRFFRDECTVHDDMCYYKDIRRLNRDIRNVVLIDDQLTSLKELATNQVLIQKFTGTTDSLLPRMEQLFVELAEYETLVGNLPQRWFEGEM